MRVIKITTNCALLRFIVCKLLRHNKRVFFNVVSIACVDLTNTSILTPYELYLNTIHLLSTCDYLCDRCNTDY